MKKITYFLLSCVIFAPVHSQNKTKKMLTTWSGNFAQAAAGAMQQCMKTTIKDTMKKTFQPFNNNFLSLKNEMSKMNSSLSAFNKKNIKEQQHQQKQQH